MALIEAAAAVLSKYMTIWPRVVDERSAWGLLHVLMTHDFRMSRALRQTGRIAATECARALSCFNWTAGDSLT